MKKTLLIGFTLMIAIPSFAQWTTLGSNIYYNSGNVGIGTTSPIAKFQVASNQMVLSGNAPFLSFYDAAATTRYGYLQLNNANSNLLLSNEMAGGIQFLVNGGTEKMRIDATGNVAIGTTDPKDYKLAVNGDAITTSMTVKLYANWPDYVFKKKYILPSLIEVKTYIDKNQRLPEMPSEAEVIKNGINLGEMVKLQTKKIEELTLYLIQQQQTNQNQQQQIDLLKKQLSAITKPSASKTKRK